MVGSCTSLFFITTAKIIVSVTMDFSKSTPKNVRNIFFEREAAIG